MPSILLRLSLLASAPLLVGATSSSRSDFRRRFWVSMSSNPVCSHVVAAWQVSKACVQMQVRTPHEMQQTCAYDCNGREWARTVQEDDSQPHPGNMAYPVDSRNFLSQSLAVRGRSCKYLSGYDRRHDWMASQIVGPSTQVGAPHVYLDLRRSSHLSL